jgi:hypothetical protein
MSGLFVGLGGGASVRNSGPPGYTSGAVVNPAGVAAPAIMAYGPSATAVPVNGTSSGQVAVYIGVAALLGLLLIRKSLPK